MNIRDKLGLNLEYTSAFAQAEKIRLRSTVSFVFMVFFAAITLFLALDNCSALSLPQSIGELLHIGAVEYPDAASFKRATEKFNCALINAALASQHPTCRYL